MRSAANRADSAGKANPENGRAHAGRWITGLIIAGLIGGLLLAARPWSQPSSRNAASSNAVPAVQVTRTAGDSIVNSYDPTYQLVHLEDGPYLCDAGEQTGCGVLDTLQTNDEVVMRCWVSTGPPAGETPPPGMTYSSSKWFYVNDVNGDHPRYSGFIYSELVEPDTQIVTPECTWQLELQYQYPAPTGTGAGTPTLTILGSCTTAGGTLTADSAGFTPGGSFTVSAAYPNGAPYPLDATSGTVSSQGTVAWKWPCAGDPSGQYTTTVTDDATGTAVTAKFTIGATGGPGAPPTGTGAQQPSVELAQGAPATAGSWYVISLQGFAADTTVSVTCFDSVSPTGFITFNVTTTSTGSGGTSRGCYSGDGPEHWVIAGGVESNHVNWSSAQGSPTTPTAPPPSSAAPPAPTTTSETVGGQTHTWTNYTNAGGYEGQTISAYTTVQIACRLQGFTVADGNTWWYRIASSPWSNQYYASADAFYNNGATSGSLHGTPWYDPAVPLC